MSTIDPSPTTEPGTDPRASGSDGTDGVEIRMLHHAPEMRRIVQIFQQVWGSPNELVPIEMLMAISHAGGYVAGAFDITDVGRAETDETGGADTEVDSHERDGRLLGASVGLLARHQGRPALHSHITGLLAGARSSGLGRAMKLHQQEWARRHDIEWIVWTFDPLVRRNAWFNIAVLGAEVHEYLPSFYGPMTDAMNAGDDTDRLLVAWRVDTDPDAPLRDGSASDADTGRRLEIPTPDDILTIRRTDPTEAARWRTDVREQLTAQLEAGRRVTGFTRDGSYVLEP
ncbi:MAG: GNAT family N-acetyltransferase [Actinomycetota bacterium]